MKQDGEHSHVKLKPNLTFFLRYVHLAGKNVCDDCHATQSNNWTKQIEIDVLLGRSE